MDNNKRVDFSYDFWGDPIFEDNNKFTMKMNLKYGDGFIVGYIFDTGVNAALSNGKVDVKLEKSIIQYKEDVFYFGKVLKGRYCIKLKNNDSILFNEGDIYCIIGNYYMAAQHVIENYTQLIGIFAYKNDLIKTFKEKQWYTDKINDVLNDTTFKKGIIFSENNKIEQIIDDLYRAINNGERLSIYSKALEMFNYLIANYDKKNYKKSKTYTEEQIQTVIRIKNFLDQNLDTYYSMPKLAKQFSISLSRMQSIFSDYYKMTPYRYHLNARLEKAHEQIINTDIKIIAIAESLGFSSYNKFSAAYKNKYNCTPSQNRLI